MEYKYFAYTWGGFYNEEHKKIHGHHGGPHLFGSRDERDDYCGMMYDLEVKLNARHFLFKSSEGYNCNIMTKLHRVILVNDKEYYSEYDIGVNYPYVLAKYHLEDIWYPGCNDYPLGKDFDYNNGDVKIMQEWVTGAFDIKDE